MKFGLEKLERSLCRTVSTYLHTIISFWQGARVWRVLCDLPRYINIAVAAAAAAAVVVVVVVVFGDRHTRCHYTIFINKVSINTASRLIGHIIIFWQGSRRCLSIGNAFILDNFREYRHKNDISLKTRFFGLHFRRSPYSTSYYWWLILTHILSSTVSKLWLIIGQHLRLRQSSTSL